MGTRCFVPQHDKKEILSAFHIFQHLDDLIQFLGFDLVELDLQRFDLEFGFLVGAVIFEGLHAVAFALAVLAHHDDGRRVGRLGREDEVEQDEGVGIPVVEESHHVERHPQQHEDGLPDDEAPGTHAVGHPIGESLSYAKGFGVFIEPGFCRHGSGFW